MIFVLGTNGSIPLHACLRLVSNVRLSNWDINSYWSISSWNMWLVTLVGLVNTFSNWLAKFCKQISLKLNKFLWDLEEYNALSMCNLVPPSNNILALPKPSIIFVLLDIILTQTSCITRRKIHFSCGLYKLFSLLVRHLRYWCYCQYSFLTKKKKEYT